MKFAHDMQMFADTLPARAERAATVYAAGQGDVLGPIEAQFRNVNAGHGTTRTMSWGGYYQPEVGVDDVGSAIGAYGELTRALPGNRVLSLGRASGSISRVARVGPPPLLDVRAYGSTNGLGATAEAELAWYENPVYLGAGAVTVIGAVWLLTRK